MENPFKKIEQNKKAPEHLKGKVMSDIAGIKLLMDITGLFSSNYASVAKSFLKDKKNKESK
ncbi:hypothetical protein [Xanthomarina spongicola]|uniref:Uncharacterized protein n=1 Tax=Xanthomarina spongicola TaxID=570520 RepID=A0A316DLP6_9FLAO|nr:hypothetical protein [Xanthomarina spongicola]PWK19054.1 hypothetical protein LX78_01532 [Xanthomarina spongicola]